MSYEEIKKSCLQRADTFVGKIVLGMAILAGILTFVMTVMICVSVILRYFFGASVAWATEWSEYLIYINVMLATPWVLKIDKHVRVDIFSKFLNKKGQKALNQGISLAGVLMCGVFFYYSLIATIENMRTGVLMVRIIPVPKWVMLIFLPIMSLCAIAIFIRKIIVLARHPEIQTDEDYQDYEQSLMNPDYNTAASTDIELPDYDALAEEGEKEFQQELEKARKAKMQNAQKDGKNNEEGEVNPK